MNCLDKANSDPTDRTVVIPKGSLFSSMPIEASGLNDVTLTIDGVLEVCQYFDDWPVKSGENGDGNG